MNRTNLILIQLTITALLFSTGTSLSAKPEPPDGVKRGARYFSPARLWVYDKSGKRTVWYSNGVKKAEGSYINKKRTGKWVFRYSNGKMKGFGSFKNGRMEGPWKLYFSSGEIQSEGKYKNNYRSGHWILYSSAGRKKSEGIFKNGYKHGPWTEYYSNGKVFYTGKFCKNLECGHWKYYLVRGLLVKSGRFSRGARVGKWYICVKGQCGYKHFKASDSPRRSGYVSSPGKRDKRRSGSYRRKEPGRLLDGLGRGRGRRGKWK